MPSYTKKIKKRVGEFIAPLIILLAAPSFAAHPLISDDTGTQGKGNQQLELSWDRINQESEGVNRRSLDAVWSLGVVDSIDVSLYLPYTHVSHNRVESSKGVGDGSANIKWRFLESESWSMAATYSIGILSGDEDKGLGDDELLNFANVIAQKQWQSWQWLINAGWQYQHHGDSAARDHNWQVSSAMLYHHNSQWTWLADIGYRQNPIASSSNAPGVMVLGVIYHLNPDLDIDVGYHKGVNTADKSERLGLGVAIRW
ncbi:transporter [Dasania marina]|uniref:transporter n=1 Tax=Dasania marina TaxID=471499 RepID=UPI0030D7879E|tara:strand:+ start:74539 stop:75309 length:771 start_codon:yes stop_codon:yes gene_type:complete